jgi:uncharacterized Zn finger protein (UPF0148 family)
LIDVPNVEEVMILAVRCDNCGKEGSDVLYDNEGKDLCPRCLIEEEIKDLDEEYKEKKSWLKATFLKDLASTRRQLRELKEKLKSM